jgi:hypothetical protein
MTYRKTYWDWCDRDGLALGSIKLQDDGSLYVRVENNSVSQDGAISKHDARELAEAVRARLAAIEAERSLP